MLDRLIVLAYRGAYRMMRVYWRVLHPTTHGALVAVWHLEQILLVRNSYVRYHTLPGGYLRRGESGEIAARRELFEEVGLDVLPEQLRLALDVTHAWEGKQDHVQIFEIVVQDRPQVRVDHREVVAAELVDPLEALRRDLFPPLRDYLRQRLVAANRSTVPEGTVLPGARSGATPTQ
jgi:8-oxo-dGTP diphosphatase